MVAHWVGCLWFLIGFVSIEINKEGSMYGISPNGLLRDNPNFADVRARRSPPRRGAHACRNTADGPPAPHPAPARAPAERGACVLVCDVRRAWAQYVRKDGAFGDSWLMRHFGPKNLHGDWPRTGYMPERVDSVAYRSHLEMGPNGTTTAWGRNVVEVSQLYVTAIYWSFTMLMKSPHIGPDTWLEKLFACVMVILGLFVTTQLVAVVTQIVMSFDKAHSAFRDRQQEYNRFAFSRSLPGPLRRKLLSYSLQDWSVNGGYDPNEVIHSLGLPPALTHSMLAAIYDDVVQESNLLKAIEKPVLHELLKYVKVVVSLQKETLVHQSDPCTRMYIMRAGSLQASATDKLMQQSAGGDSAPAAGKGKKALGRQTTGWKQKMQVRMIEKPGDIICCASPYEPPQPLPFQVTSLKRTTLLSIHMQDLLAILDIVSEAQTEAICKQMQREHRNILLSVMPKQKNTDASTRESRVDADGGAGRDSVADQPQHFGERDLSERRLNQIETEIDRVIGAMKELHHEARQLPRLVQALSAMQGKPLPSGMGPHATAALSANPPTANPVGSPAESEVNALIKEVS